ncbi:MAG TPA: aminoglycoside phosphotransferase family protein [Acidimicrobiales bacterium]|nr:aminoglycoside phosphotransferase family protein [Acidimicrobiales bacterium]
MVQGDDGAWDLPTMTFPEYVPIDGAFTWHVSQRIGAPATRVRTVARQDDDRVVEMELHGEPPPETTRWVAVAELDDEAVRAWRTDRDAVPPERPAWQRPGWWNEATAWVEDELARVGHTRSGAIEQLKHWSISAVLMVPTDRGGVVLKQVPPLFAAEGPLIELLHGLVPGSVPEPLAVDRSNHRWLMVRFDGSPDTGAPDDALRRLAELQRATVGRRDEILGVGCPDRGLDRLEQDVLALADRADLLDPAVRKKLGAALPDLTRRVAVLREAGLPETVVHGDFHQWNSVASPDGSFIVFDWTDAAWGHPFMDLSAWLGRSKDQAASVATYLDGWAAERPADDLRRAWSEAEPLSYLHYAIGYQRIIEGTHDPSWSPELGRLVECALSVASGDG